jgi:hypothetical protein
LAAAALLVLPVGLLVTMGATAAQAGGAVTFKGNISCSLVGTVTFKPELSFSQKTKPTVTTFKGTNSDCTGVDGTKLTQGGETLTGSTENFTFTTKANKKGSCYGLVGPAPAIPKATVDWTGTSPIASTTLKLAAGNKISSKGLIEYLKGKATGSFAGTARVALQATSISESPPGGTLPYSTANAAAACKGPGIADLGLSQPNPEPKPFSTNDNLEIGPAF